MWASFSGKALLHQVGVQASYICSLGVILWRMAEIFHRRISAATEGVRYQHLLASITTPFRHIHSSQTFNLPQMTLCSSLQTNTWIVCSAVSLVIRACNCMRERLTVVQSVRSSILDYQYHVVSCTDSVNGRPTERVRIDSSRVQRSRAWQD